MSKLAARLARGVPGQTESLRATSIVLFIRIERIEPIGDLFGRGCVPLRNGKLQGGLPGGSGFGYSARAGIRNRQCGADVDIVGGELAGRFELLGGLFESAGFEQGQTKIVVSIGIIGIGLNRGFKLADCFGQLALMNQRKAKVIVRQG